MAVVFRMCAVCREKRPKSELLRIVKSPDGKIYIDEEGKRDGRGMYICRDKDCCEKAAKRRVVEKAFKTAPGDIYDGINNLPVI